MAQVLSAFTFIHDHHHGRLSLTRFSAFHFFLFLLSVPVFLFHLELFPELLDTKDMANLRLSTAKESEETLNVFHCSTELRQLRFLKYTKDPGMVDTRICSGKVSQKDT